MTTDSTLSLLGKKVLLLESQKKLGGLSQSFRRKDLDFDIGVHEVCFPKEDYSKYVDFWNLITDGKAEWTDFDSTKYIFKNGEQVFNRQQGIK